MSFEQTQEEVENAFYPTADSEPLEKPTEEPEEDETPEEPEEGESEESEAEEESEDEEGDTLVYEIDGKEYTAQQIKEFEAGHLRQADYTKKTQALSEERKQVDEKSKLLDSEISKLSDYAEQLEVLVNEDGEVNWDELKEDDLYEYVKLKDKADARKAKLAEIKAKQPQSASKFDADAERVKLVEANPQWLDEKQQPTSEYKNDMTLLSDFYQTKGVDQDLASFINQSSFIANLVLQVARDEAKGKAKSDKQAEAKKKIIATPKSGKPKGEASQLTAEEIFYGKK